MSRRNGGDDDAFLIAFLIVGGLVALALIINAIDKVLDTIGEILTAVLIGLALGVVVLSVTVVVVGLGLLIQRTVEGRWQR